MLIGSAALFRAAGRSAALALVALVIAGVTLALFFARAGDVYGSINDLTFALMMIALLLPMVAIDRLASAQVGPWLRFVTIAATGGAVLVAIGQVLLVVRVIDLNASFVTGGLGSMPVLVWMVALAVLWRPLGRLPLGVGGSAAATLAAILLAAIVSVVTTGPFLWIATGAVVVALVVWLGGLSVSLLGLAKP